LSWVDEKFEVGFALEKPPAGAAELILEKLDLGTHGIPAT